MNTCFTAQYILYSLIHTLQPNTYFTTQIDLITRHKIKSIIIMGCNNSSSLENSYNPVPISYGRVYHLSISNYIWEKDYQGLFDYEAKEVRKIGLELEGDGWVEKEEGGNESRAILSFKQIENKSDVLFKVVKKPNYFRILPQYLNLDQDVLLHRLIWLVVKYLPRNMYPLRQRDILKFGKQKMRIRQIVHAQMQPSVQDFNDIKTTKKIYQDLGPCQNDPISKQPDQNQIQSIVTDNEPTCRICLQPGQLTNPLICPCKCTGSVRYIHLKCLRMWLGKRLNVTKTKVGVIIRWTPLQCEMCKGKYSYRIWMDGKRYYTVEIPKPKKPYVVLECIKRTSSSFNKLFHFVSFSELGKISIGRKKEIDVKISDDVSVSRHHANLIYTAQRQVYLEDNRSKFGTLVLVKKSLRINPLQRGIGVQIGAEVYRFESVREELGFQGYKQEEEYKDIAEIGEKQEDSDDEDADALEQEEDQELNNPQNPPPFLVQNQPPPQQPSHVQPLLINVSVPIPPTQSPLQIHRHSSFS